MDAETSIELSENQRKNPPLGSGRASAVAFEAERAPASQLLILSDGVWKFTGFEAIVAAARQMRGLDLVFELRGAQLDGNNGKLPDDFSIIVVS